MVNKKRVALIGPISCNAGIATVVKTIVNSTLIKNKYEITFINTSNYKDNGFFKNLIIFIKSLN